MGCCQSKKKKAPPPKTQAETDEQTLAVVFIDACLDGNLKKVKSTFDSVNAAGQIKFLKFKDDQDNIPLHLACENGHDEVAEELLTKALTHGIDTEIVNLRNKNQETPLSLVCQRGFVMPGEEAKAIVSRSAIVEALFTHGANLNMAHPLSQYLPLHWAAYNQDDNLVKQMLHLGADPLNFGLDQLPVDIAGDLNLPFCVNAFLEDYLAKLEARLLEMDCEDDDEGGHKKPLENLWYRQEAHEIIRTNNSLLENTDNGLAPPTPLSAKPGSVSKEGGFKKLKEGQVLLIKDDIDESLQNTINQHYMFWACKNDALRLVRLLYENCNVSPFEPVSIGVRKQMPLYAAIKDSAYEVLKYCLSLSLPEHKTALLDERKNTPLHEAYRTSNDRIIMMVRERSVMEPAYGSLQSVNQLGRVPTDVPHQRVEQEADYMIMVDKSRQELVQELIERGFNENYKKLIPKTKLKDNKVLDYKFFDYTENPDKYSILALFFSNELLDHTAEKMGMMVQEQERYLSLPFVATCAHKFKRFSASQRYAIINNILKNGALDLEQGLANGMYKQHFMLHDSQLETTKANFEKDAGKLIWAFHLSNWFRYLQPISVIQLYYGEKHAMYMTFLLHHIGMLIIPTVVGLALFSYHIYLTVIHYEAEIGPIDSYQKQIDTPYNLIYQIFFILWSTIYVESWKRKESTLKYLWSSTEVMRSTSKNSKRNQMNSQVIYDPVSGSKAKRVLNRSKGKVICNSISGVLLNMFLAVLAFVLYQLAINTYSFQEWQYNTSWKWLWVIIYSYMVIKLNGLAGRKTKQIVAYENKRYEQDHENGLIRYSYLLAFVNCYIGLFFSMIQRKFASMNFILFTILIFKQIILNIIELCEPLCSKPSEFDKHKRRFNNKASADQPSEDRMLHYQIEKQMILDPTPAYNVGAYNEVVIQFGWLAFFSVVFPAGPFFCLISTLVQMKTEVNTMTKFQRRDRPLCAEGIGNWKELLDIASFFCVIVNLYILLFVSDTTKSLFAGTNDQGKSLIIILTIVLIEHLLFAAKSILEGVIPDSEAWVEEEQESAADILVRVEEGIQAIKLGHYVKDQLPSTLISEITNHFNFDKHKEKKLVKKIIKGCENYDQPDSEEEEEDEGEENLARIKKTKALQLERKRKMNDIRKRFE